MLGNVVNMFKGKNKKAIQRIRKCIKIVFSNLKGGVGKTMSLYQISAFLAERGFKVLCLDLDPQGNLTRAFLPKRVTPSMYEWFNGKTSFEEIIKQPYKSHEVLKNIYLLPNTYDLFLVKETETSTYTVDMLKELMEPYNDMFDFILIDTHPSLCLTNLNAYVYADYILAVFDNSLDSIEGFQYLNNTVIEPVRQYSNKSLSLLGILLNHTDRRTTISKEFTKTLNKLYEHDVFETVIPMAVVNQESRLYRTPVLVYDKKNEKNSSSYGQYSQLTSEILKRLKIDTNMEVVENEQKQ